MIYDLGFDIEKSLQFYTINVSKSLELYPRKGAIEENSNANLIIIDEDMDIDIVTASGRIMLKDKQIIIKGIYENDIKMRVKY